jgi:hypothetical protein
MDNFGDRRQSTSAAGGITAPLFAEKWLSLYET